jgi:hypothetical protein
VVATERYRGVDSKVLIVLTLGLFAARLILSMLRSGPVLVADEIGYLMNARLLAGGLPGQLELAPFYHGGYSILLAPLVGWNQSPAVAYRFVLACNAALAASVLPLLYVLLTRCARVAPRLALGAAIAGAAYPTVTVLSQVAMSENALFPLTCLWLIALSELLHARGSYREVMWAAAVSTSAAALWAVHGRMLTAVILTAALVTLLAIRRRLRLAGAIAALSALGAGLWAVLMFDSYLVAHNYGGHVANETDVRLQALAHPHALLIASENLLGQTWYLMAATFGLAAVVCAAAVQRAPDSRVTADVRQLELIRIVVALTMLLLLVSAASFPDRARPDMLIYGRYVEVVAPPLLALGLVLLRRARYAGTWVGFAAFAVLTAAVMAFRAGSGPLRGANRWNVASLPFVTAQLGPAIVFGAAVVATIGAWLLSRACARRPGIAWIVVLGLFLPTVAYGVWNPVWQSERSFYPAGWTSPEPVARALGITSMGYDVDHIVGGLYSIQWFLPHTSVVLYRGNEQKPPSRYLLSDGEWGREHPGADAVRLWSSKGRDLVLWRLHG